MPTAIPVSNILQPPAVSQAHQNRTLMVDLQILKPIWYSKFTERYGNQDLTWWLSSVAGMEQVKNRNFFWFERRGKLMVAVVVGTAVSTPSANATITVSLDLSSVFTTDNLSPIRAGETVYIASNNVGGEILTVDSSAAPYYTFTVRPKKLGQAFASPSGNLDAGEVLIFGGGTDVGESSTSIAPIIPLPVQFSNNITEFHDSWSNTDLAQMADTYFEIPVSSDIAAMGVTPFTYLGMRDTLTRFKNNVERKLIVGDVKTNTGFSGGSVGTQGFIPQAQANGAITLGYTPLNLDLSKLYEVTNILDVNGCDKQIAWLADMFQREDFTDGIFKEFPAGAFVWGQGERSKENAIAYGFDQIFINEYMLNIKKYKNFNTEYYSGLSPATDYFRYFGAIYDMGSTPDAKTGSDYSNLTVMYQQPPEGGTVGNGIRLWRWGGGSPNPTDGTLNNQIEIATYRAVRLCAANHVVFLSQAS
jgi:hypothetical protein